MGRTIAYFVVICTLLVMLGMTVLDGGASDPGVVEPTPPQGEPATATLPTSEWQPTTTTAKAEAQSPPRSEADILAAITRQPLPDVVSPPWADEMEGVILNHIAQRPGLELTELQAQCAEEQCVIFLGGNSIPMTKWALTCLRASMDSTVPSFRAWTAARTVLCICADERERTNAHLRPQRPRPLVRRALAEGRKERPKIRLCRRPRIGGFCPPKCDTRASYKWSDRAECACPAIGQRLATTIYGTHPNRVVRYWWVAH